MPLGGKHCLQFLTSDAALDFGCCADSSMKAITGDDFGFGKSSESIFAVPRLPRRLYPPYAVDHLPASLSVDFR